tara:strand:+ start:509 stop:823 length:315 start_codon:yes stop_codon:yes gene_type:complete
MFNGSNDLLQDRLVQVSIFSAILFLVGAHEETFKFVDGILQIKDRNTLLIVHAVVVALLMYFGTKLIFDPVFKGVVEGFTKSAAPKPRVAPKAKKNVGRAPSRK